MRWTFAQVAGALGVMAGAGLDPVAMDVMSAVLREQANAGIPVMFSSHQLDLVERLCDRVVLIAGGIGISLLLLVFILLGIVYPRIGAWMIRDRVGGKLARKLLVATSRRPFKLGAPGVQVADHRPQHFRAQRHHCRHWRAPLP